MTPPPRSGLPAGLIAAAGAVLMGIASFLSWLTTHTETDGMTTVSGFGSISGDTPLAGGNLNDLLDTGGLGSFRPGLVGLIVGGVALMAGLTAALLRPSSPRPLRIVGAVLAAAGLVGVVWGGVRGFRPGTGGVLNAGEGGSGAGPWLTAGAGLLVLVAGCWLLGGRAARMAGRVERHRGIQG